MASETEIQNFYRDRTIFLTGGSGFLGKVFIEKLLRVTEVERVYLLMRSKKDKDAKERFDELFQNPLFDKLLHEKPNVLKRLYPIYGDCSMVRLGLSDEDYSHLLHNVEIVVHNAATVRFNEPLSVALAINVRSIIDLLQMAKKMRKLKAFVHVSSAFSNSYQFETNEKFYTENLNHSAECLMDTVNVHGVAHLDSIADDLCAGFENTYVFSKALAEDAIEKEAMDLPICVIRPSIITPTYKEPISGWTDNYYGPVGVLANVAHGVLHVMQIDGNKYAPTVPVDFCANLMLSSAWVTAQQPRSEGTPPLIYNLSTDNTNGLTWNDMFQHVVEFGSPIPLNKMVWYPTFTITSSTILYKILWFFYHTIPAFFLDLMLWFRGKKPMMRKMYPKLRKHIDVLTYFACRNWSFGMDNTLNLWSTMSDKDRELFDFNLATLDWRMYFSNGLRGMRLYTAKEQPDSIPEALKLLKKFQYTHWMFKKILQGTFFYSIYKLYGSLYCDNSDDFIAI